MDGLPVCIVVDGTYVKVNARLQPLVHLLADGCSEADLRGEIDALKPGHSYTVLELREFINNLFLRHSLAIDEHGITSCAVWRLCSTITGKTVAGMESALRCRVTVVPEAPANRVAQALRSLYTWPGFSLAALVCGLMNAGYLFRFGLASLSPDLLFKSIHQATALSVAVTILAVLFSTLFHEVGHCTAVAAFGLRVRRIGFGIYWLSPALFSDVSAAWTLKRRQQVAVDCGGIYFQVVLCSIYALCASLIDSTPMQNALRIAIVANMIAMVTSLNPIMKCDGYWIVSDAMAIPNLRRESERAMRNFGRRLFGQGNRISAAERKSGGFLLGYGILSILFSALTLLLFGIVICRNAAEAIYFPRELIGVLHRGAGSANLGPECSHLALELLKVLPVACAPIAFLSATSALSGFLRRTFSDRE